VRVDPFDERAVADWHATVTAADVRGREEWATPWTLAETLVAVRAEQSDLARDQFGGVVEGRVVVAGELGRPLVDNREHARIQVYTHPDHTRRGYGSAMLAHLEQVAREHGRAILDAEAAWSYDIGTEGRGTAPAEFFLKHGYRFGLGDVHRVLALPVDDELLRRLAAEAAPHHAAYAIRSWTGPAPDELVESLAALIALLMVEAPSGDMQRAPESADVEAFRRAEEVTRLQGRTMHTSAALDAAGTVVAYTNVVTTDHDPDNAFQWGTLVRREDRGHRLGLAVKVAAMRLLQSGDVRARRMHTWNAEVNHHMIGINEQLGYRPVERLGEFQKFLT
jgi:GNAT superfamily N-acetyltransferase